MPKRSTDGTQRPAILFVHLPKTGGTSFAEALARSLPPERVLGHPFDTALLAQRRNELTRYDLVIGHVPFSTLGAMRQPAHAVSLFRDPCQRALSAFRHLQRSKDHPHHALLQQEAPRFADALKHPALQLHFLSPYTRFLGPGPGDLTLPLQVDEALLRRALANLDGLATLGLTEAIETDGPRCLAALGLPAMQIRHRNRAPASQESHVLSKEEEALLTPLLEADLVLWEAARARRSANAPLQGAAGSPSGGVRAGALKSSRFN